MSFQPIAFFLLFFTVFISELFSQSAIHLPIDSLKFKSSYGIISVSPNTKNTYIVKYISCVKTIAAYAGENYLNGFACNDSVKSHENPKGYVKNSDKVLVLLEQEITAAGKILNENITLISIRPAVIYSNINPEFKAYPNIVCEKGSNPYLKNGAQIKHHYSDFSTIENLNSIEKKLITKFLDKVVFMGQPYDQYLEHVRFHPSTPGLRLFVENLTSEHFVLPKNEKLVRLTKLDDNLWVCVTRDKVLEREKGTVYKTYFSSDGVNLGLKDSSFFNDVSDFEYMHPVTDLNSRSIKGVLLNFSCEKKLPQKKTDNYFRSIYIDKKSVRKWKFHLNNNKPSSFSSYLTLINNDSIVNIATEKSGFMNWTYKSYVYTSDSIFPTSPSAGISYSVVSLPGISSSSTRGSDPTFILIEKLGPRTFVIEQSINSAAFAGVAKAGEAGADRKGYSTTLIYSLENSSITGIKRIAIPYFNEKTTSYSCLKKTNEFSYYFFDFPVPCLIRFSINSETEIKPITLNSYTLTANPLTDRYTIDVGDVSYLYYWDKSQNKLMLKLLD